MRRLITLAAILLSPAAGFAQADRFAGDWLLWLEQDNKIGRPAVGSLVMEPDGDSLAIYIDGGPVHLLELDGNHIVFDFDWTDLPDLVHVSILDGTLVDGVIEGTVTEEGEDRGAWRATRKAQQDTSSMPADPVDFTGIYDAATILSKDEFELTEAGHSAHEAYDSTIDDPVLRCVTDGLIRMSHGPFDIEVVERPSWLLVLHEDLHEIRRIYTDGRDFPEGIEYEDLAMGYSIGHWEDSTLVVETRGLKPAVWDAGGWPMTTNAVVTERWYFGDDEQLNIEFSVSDPAHFDRPPEMHLMRPRRADDAQISEYSCDPHPFYRGMQLEGRLEEYWGRGANRL